MDVNNTRETPSFCYCAMYVSCCYDSKTINIKLMKPWRVLMVRK